MNRRTGGNIQRLNYIKMNQTQASLNKEVLENKENLNTENDNINELHSNDTPVQNSLPKFLSNNFKNKKSKSDLALESTKLDFSSEKEDLKEKNSKSRQLLPFSDSKKNNFNPNSFSSVFNREHEQITGIQRVFRKSMIFMVITILLASILGVIGLNLFVINPLVTVLFLAGFVAISNIFYIVVADRSYVWLCLTIQAIFIIIINNFVGQGFNLITLLSTLVITMLSYISYTELEKVQLGSRLFSISHITKESTRASLSIALLIVCVSSFNGMLNMNSAEFVDNIVFKYPIIRENFILGNPTSSIFAPVERISVNSILINGSSNFGKGNTKFTFGDFLAENYKGGSIVTTAEIEDITAGCTKTPERLCAQELINKKTEDYRKESYEDLPYTIDTVLGEKEYNEVSKAFYVNMVEDFIKGSGSNDYILIPRTFIIPAGVAAFIYLISILLRPLFGIISFIFTWLLWAFLKVIGFAQIEIETVEAEVVSI